MTSAPTLSVFGEVLFDQFPSGDRVLGGAPFNVAWHLQALGDRPQFISRVGDDGPGREILQAMSNWGMSTAWVQRDPQHPTGQVLVEIVDSEPRYQIVPGCAYDFITADRLPSQRPGDLLYHGTLALRNSASRSTLEMMLHHGRPAIFFDVNLRTPWWQADEVRACLQRARWVKLNQEELRLLGFLAENLEQAVDEFQKCFALEQVILTRGAAGALVRTSGGATHRVVPGPAEKFVDAVGAGDAFCALYLHGLMAGWPIPETLAAAQRFASMVVGLRGATTDDEAFYRRFRGTLP